MANAAHIKNVPGRKTDVNDATWIADLVACGLVKASFVPDEPIQDLRTLLRARKQLTREQTRHIQRIQKTLEAANITLDSVVSDIMGVSGRRMIAAMMACIRTPTRLAELADRRIKASPKALYDALHGRLTDHHCLMLRFHPTQYDGLAAAIAQIDQEVDALVARMDAQAVAGRATFRALIILLVYDPRHRPLGRRDDPRGNRLRHLGIDHFDRRSTEVKANRLVAQLAKFGYQAALQPLAEAA